MRAAAFACIYLLLRRFHRPERIVPGPVSDLQGNCEAVCIHTRKIYDSCRDKDCVEDLRFYPTAASQETLCRAQTVKGGRAELLYTYIDVEPVVFNRGFYTVDLRYFYRVVLNAYCSSSRPVEVEGLCVFDKRVILFGSEGIARIFSSHVRAEALDRQMMERSNLPVAVVETADIKQGDQSGQAQAFLGEGQVPTAFIAGLRYTVSCPVEGGRGHGHLSGSCVFGELSGGLCSSVGDGQTLRCPGKTRAHGIGGDPWGVVRCGLYLFPASAGGSGVPDPCGLRTCMGGDGKAADLSAGGFPFWRSLLRTERRTVGNGGHPG